MKSKKPKNKISSKKRYVLLILSVLLLIYIINFIFYTTKTLPEGTSIEGKIYHLSEEQIKFLYDLTYETPSGEKKFEQTIFDNFFKIIDESQRFIFIDAFLFNTDYSENVKFRNLTTDLKNKLIEKKKLSPEIKIYFTTDEINNFYGAYISEEILELKQAGIVVTITKMEEMRDSNPLYSAFWRAVLQPFGTSGKGWITHPLGNSEEKITLRSLFKLINAKANHRKLIVADKNNTLISLVTSANPHDASSKHSNVAFLIQGDIGKDIIDSEIKIAHFSGTSIENPDYSFMINNNLDKDIAVQFLSEGKIKSSILEEIKSTKSGDKISMAMFYLSERDIINSLLDASQRGVEINLILDSNKDAFAREKNGIPNRPVANELIERSGGKIKIRWYNTLGEQFHSKLIMIQKNEKTIIFLGSANLTKRNIGDFNIESEIKAVLPSGSLIALDIENYFNRIWGNLDGNYTLPFESYSDDSLSSSMQYHLQEFSGISTF